MASATANPAVGSENKTSKRKKNKGGDAAAKPEDRAPLAEVTANTNGVDSAEAPSTEVGESAYVKELSKNLRNLRKRLTNTQKVDSIIAANPGKSLVQLLNEKLINPDQKQQAENKPSVEAQIKSTTERLSHYKAFEDELHKRYTAEKDVTAKSHSEALEKVKEEAYSKAKSEAKEETRTHLLSLSRFLRAAAASRQSEDKVPEEGAFEGALLLVYGGDISAVDSILSLVNGDEAIVPKTDGTPSGFSFKQVRDKSLEQLTAVEAAPETTAAESSAAEPASDPTIVHASLTEIEQANTESETALAELDGHVEEVAAETGAVPEVATIDAGAANAVATVATTNPALDPMTSSISNDWTEVPRDPAETDTGLKATPAANSTNAWAESTPAAGNADSWNEAAPAGTGSWAEDVPADAPPANDGFSEVQGRNRGRGRGGRGGGGGEYRGRGRGGRGRGGRGDGEYRGRGRGGRGGGGFRGGRGGAEGGQS